MRALKILLFLTWLALLGLLVSRDFFIPELSNKEAALLKNSREEQYYGIWFQNKRIGYVKEKLRAGQDKEFLLAQKALMNLSILNTTQTITMDLHATLDTGSFLKNFRFNFHSPFYAMQAKGTVKNKTVSFRLDTGRAVIHESLKLSRPPLLEMNDRSYLLKELPQKGDKVKISSFDPLSLTDQDMTVQYLGKEKILIHGRIFNLHSFVKTFSGIRIKFWLNDEGKVIKEQSAAGFTFLAEPKFKAMDVVKAGSDLLSDVAVRYTGEPPLARQRSAVYRLTLPNDVALDLEGGRQKFSHNILTVTRETIPAANEHATMPGCDDPESLKPSAYVQSDNPEIKNMARQIIGREQNRVRQVRLLEEWVYKNLERRPVLGLPDALTTLKSRQGDCNEHAALFAALTRSVGIPTTIAAGVTLFRGAFYYHAWNEVCLNSRWISLDSTNNQFPADLTHIRFARGDMAQQIKIGALLGKLAIEIIPPANSEGNAK